MRAVTYEGWRGALHLVDRPSLNPRRGQVRVRVQAAALNPKDVLVHSGRFAWLTGRTFPRTPGYDYAGEVDAVGPGMEDVPLGTPVFGFTRGWPGGTLAEQVLVTRQEFGVRPAGVSAEQASALPLVGCTVLQGFRDQVRLRPGERVLVHGASGGVGTAAVMIARALGAVPTAVCSEANASFVRDLGASDVLPYDRGALAASADRWDVVFDAFGTLPYARARRYLAAGGRHLSLVVRGSALLPAVAGLVGLVPAYFVSVRPDPADFDQLARWVESGALRAVIDQTLPLDQVQSGFDRLRSKRTRGKVVVRVSNAH